MMRKSKVIENPSNLKDSDTNDQKKTDRKESMKLLNKSNI